MNIRLNNIKNGKYELIGNNLYFNNEEIIIDKKSALEIMTTLLDSINMLDENLIIDVEEKINGNL